MSHGLLHANPGLAKARFDCDRAVAKLMNRPVPSTSAFTLDDSVSQDADDESDDGDDDAAEDDDRSVFGDEVEESIYAENEEDSKTLFEDDEDLRVL